MFINLIFSNDKLTSNIISKDFQFEYFKNYHLKNINNHKIINYFYFDVFKFLLSNQYFPLLSQSECNNILYFGIKVSQRLIKGKVIFIQRLHNCKFNKYIFSAV